MSLFTLHVIWPFLWIWATLWHKENGWGNGNRQKEAELFESMGKISEQLPELEKQNLKLETELATLRQELNVLTQKLAMLENNQHKDGM